MKDDLFHNRAQHTAIQNIFSFLYGYCKWGLKQAPSSKKKTNEQLNKLIDI
jgi:hypothetical protein